MSGETDEVTRHLAGRVVAPVLALHVDARQLERESPSLSALGAQVTLQVQELLVHAARDAANQQSASRPSVDGEIRARGPRPAASSLGLAQTLSTGVLIASGSPLRSRNRAAVRGNLFGSQVTRIGLLVKEVLIEHLQIARHAPTRATATMRKAH